MENWITLILSNWFYTVNTVSLRRDSEAINKVQKGVPGLVKGFKGVFYLESELSTLMHSKISCRKGRHVSREEEWHAWPTEQ